MLLFLHGLVLWATVKRLPVHRYNVIFTFSFGSIGFRHSWCNGVMRNRMSLFITFSGPLGSGIAGACGWWVMLHFPVSLMNRLKQTWSAFRLCRFTLFPNDPLSRLFDFSLKTNFDMSVEYNICTNYHRIKQTLNKFEIKWCLVSYFPFPPNYDASDPGLFEPIRTSPERFDNSEV